MNKRGNKKYKVVSLFSGCGGLDLGIEGNFVFLGKHYSENPFEIVWANDINKKATETQKLNFPNTTVVCGDITKIVGLSDEKSKQGTLDGVIEPLCTLDDIPDADVVVGGFPCQDFSLAGKRRGLTAKRGNLYLSMAKVIESKRPKIFLAENVKGLLSWGDGLAIKTITEDFAALGYTVDYKLLNTADYGVPETRERVIIVGVRDDLNLKIKWVKPTHSDPQVSNKLKPWVTLKEALGDIEDEEVQKKLPNFGYSRAKLCPGKQGNTKTKADRPGPTMRAEHHGNIEYHYSLPRRLSAREAARIQSFPDNFEFVSSVTDTYRQVGNAVAPVFGWHLAQMLKNTLGANNE